MQQSDTMLLSTLKQFLPLPPDLTSLTSLSQIRTQHIYAITCSLFDLLQIDYKQLKQIPQTQRFRSMTKLTQFINTQMDGNFDLNDIMNPTVGVLRKLLLAYVGKLTAAQGDRNRAMITQGKGIKGSKGESGMERDILRKWVNQEYVCPELRIKKKVRFQPHLLKIQLKKDIFKRNILNQLSGNPGNANSIIRTAMLKQNVERKKRQAQQGLTRRIQEQNQRNIGKIIKNNVEDWQKAQATMKKLKKQLLKTEQSMNQNIKNQNNEMSVFQQQVSQIVEQQKKLKGNQDKKTQQKSSTIQSLEQDMDPLQKIKRQCENTRIALENELNTILQSINQAKQDIEQKQILKQKLHDQIVLYEEKAAAQREARAGIKKQVEKQKILLDTIEGETDIAEEVRQLEQEVKYLEVQAEKQVKNLEGQIQSTKKEGQEKLQALKDLKLKLNKIENDYTKVCQQIEQKNQIKGKIKITKSGLSRLYYSKKISQMQTRWRQTQKQSKKIAQQIKKLNQQVRRSLNFVQSSQTQIKNISNSSKLRNQPQNTSFKQILQKCQKSFQQTMKCIEQINETKNQIQEYEMKVHVLTGKDYKENIKKLQIALSQLKREMGQVRGKK